MLDTGSATILMIVNFAFAGVLGIAAGAIARVVLTKHWGIRAVAMDAALAITAAVIGAVVILRIDEARGVVESRVGFVFTVAPATVVAVSLIRAYLNHRPRQGGAA